jgi:hypothetical protein
VLSGLLTACTAKPDSSGPDITWTEHVLPSHPGKPGRNVVRDATKCGGEWYVVGAVFLDEPSETRDTRPAAWSSPDAQSWRPIEVKTDTYWGKRAILNSVACSRGRIAVVGARSGGAHGNPRVTTFHASGSGSLVDVQALFTQFGGVTATNVGPISGGENGWIIAGNRLSGPGVWVTDDPRNFTKVEDEPGLTDDGDIESLAQAGAWDEDSWVLVGGGAQRAELLNREPLAWTSPDGLTWTSEKVPAAPESEDIHRLVGLRDGRLLGVGLSGDAFGAWVRDDGTWTRSATFGSISKEYTGAPYVASLAQTSLGVLTTLSNGASYELWLTEDGDQWEQLDVPLAPDVAGDHSLAIGSGHDPLLLGDAGANGRIWLGEASAATSARPRGAGHEAVSRRAGPRANGTRAVLHRTIARRRLA